MTPLALAMLLQMADFYPFWGWEGFYHVLYVAVWTWHNIYLHVNITCYSINLYNRYISLKKMYFKWIFIVHKLEWIAEVNMISIQLAQKKPFFLWCSHKPLLFSLPILKILNTWSFCLVYLPSIVLIPILPIMSTLIILINIHTGCIKFHVLPFSSLKHLGIIQSKTLFFWKWHLVDQICFNDTLKLLLSHFRHILCKMLSS